jgi:hypothetical protein
VKKILLCLSKSDEIKEDTRVADSDPDPYWIRIQSGQWIWIRIRNAECGSVFGIRIRIQEGKKNQQSTYGTIKKLRNFIFGSAGCSLL